MAAVDTTSDRRPVGRPAQDGAEQTTGSPRLSPADLAMTALLRGALRGAALGLAWGSLPGFGCERSRRNPDFSWAGTITIVGLAIWLGNGIGTRLLAVARGTRHRPSCGIGSGSFLLDVEPPDLPRVIPPQSRVGSGRGPAHAGLFGCSVLQQSIP